MAWSRRTSLLILACLLLAAASGVVVWWALSGQRAVSQRVPDPQEERVRGPGRVRGVVFEARREVPVARASITAFGQTQSIVTASNEDGSFEFASFDSFVEVVAEAPGLRNAGADDRGVRLRVDPDSVIDGLRIYLYEPCEVVGSVSGDGRPVEAEVVAHFAQDASGAMDYDAAVTTTDFDGSFKLGGLPPGLLELRVQAEGFAPYVSEAVEMGAGDVLSLGEIRLARGATLRGLVLDQDGRPVDGASISVGSARTRLRGVSDADGNFKLYGVPAGLVGIELRAAGFAVFRSSIRLEANTEELIELRLSALRGLRVTVVRQDGTAVPGARVGIGLEGDPQVLRSLLFEGEDLRVDDLDGERFWVRAEHPDFSTPAEKSVGAGELAQLVLTNGAELTGLVLNANGSVADSAQVRLLDANTGRPVTGWGPSQQGRFLFQGLQPGWYQLEGSGQGHRLTKGPAFSIVDGENASQSLRLRRGGSLQGTVFDASTGQPIAGARVGLEGYAHAVLTEADGSYVLSSFPEGRATVQVSATGYRTALASGLVVDDEQRALRDFQLDPGDNPAEIELVGIGIQVQESGGRIIVRQPVEGASGALAGLQSEDEILGVDGEDASSLGLRGVIERIRGQEGSSVRLTIRRGDGAPFDLVMTRQRLVFSNQ